MKKTFLLISVLLAIVTSCQRSLTDYVNPFVGTDGHGHTFPGAILPFGMVQVSPDTRLDGWDGCSGYHYTDDTIYGFSHTHLSGTGCSDYGDLLIMPFTAENGDMPDSLNYEFYKSSFSHRSEKAEPGYYRVVLDRNRVMAELTVHGRSALHKYTFPNTGRKGVVIDLKHRDVVINSSIAMGESAPEYEGDPLAKFICGYRTSSAWNPEQHFYFAVAADSPIEEVVFYKGGHPVKSLDSIEGEDCKALVFFQENEKEVTLYVGISATGDAGAMNNLFEGTNLGVGEGKEITFNQAKKEASATWEKALGQFEVEGGSREDRTNFYTALYHCMTSPYLYSDADGCYRTMKDSTGNYNIDFTGNGREQYTVFSVWDTYRALHPLLNLTDPKRSRDFVLTMLDHFRHSGELTMWELASHETHCMIGYHSASVILD
ncbi:MAG: GH92 family glycosyl hydrolase, partial [Bacteroidales bacterium]|nr:GH92 family glycosyl hydrolase [Bacteroidales bacterium]